MPKSATVLFPTFRSLPKVEKDSTIILFMRPDLKRRKSFLTVSLYSIFDTEYIFSHYKFTFHTYLKKKNIK